MTDIFLKVQDRADVPVDIEIEAGDLRMDPGLRTPVLVSLFSDARLPADQTPPDGTTNRRGWWGTSETDPFGSLLWALRRQKITNETINAFAEAVRAALDWLVREEIVEDVQVAVERGTRDVHELTATISLVRGSASRWPVVWEGTLAYEAPIDGIRVIVLAT